MLCLNTQPIINLFHAYQSFRCGCPRDRRIHSLRQFRSGNKWFLPDFLHDGLLFFSDLFYDLFYDHSVAIFPIPHCDNLFLSVESDKHSQRIRTELRGIHLGFLHARHNLLNAASPRFNKASQVKCVGNILIAGYGSMRSLMSATTTEAVTSPLGRSLSG